MLYSNTDKAELIADTLRSRFRLDEDAVNPSIVGTVIKEIE